MLAKHLADICEGREKVHNLHYRWLDKEGMPVWINCRGIVINDQQGKAEYLVGCLNETGNKRRADNVTGLLGGPEFLAYLRAQKEPITKGFFMHVGIDDFGAINSSRGADYGNYILKSVADLYEGMPFRQAENLPSGSGSVCDRGSGSFLRRRRCGTERKDYR